MKNDRTLSNRAKLSIESYISPAELRGAHNFATAAQPIMSLELERGASVPDMPPETRQTSSPDETGPLEQPDPQAGASSGAEPETPSDVDPSIRFDIKPVIEPLIPADVPPEIPADARSGTPSGNDGQVQSSELVPHRIEETDFLIENRLTEPDPPFRAPSSWRVAHPQINAERRWNWSERSTAAFLGFAAGVLIIVPLVAFLSMTAEQPLPPAVIETAAAPDTPAEPPASPVITARVALGSKIVSRSPEVATPTIDERSETAVAVSRQPAEPTTTPGIEDAANRARSALAVGQISEARAALRMAASPDNPQLWFVLAETYDPLVVQASAKAGANTAPPPNPSDTLTAANIKFAQYYYQQALTHGIRAARARLTALQQP